MDALDQWEGLTDLGKILSRIRMVSNFFVISPKSHVRRSLKVLDQQEMMLTGPQGRTV